MLLEGGAFAQSLVPSLEVVQWRPLNWEGVPAIDLGPQRDLGKAYLLSGKKRTPIERVVGVPLKSYITATITYRFAH